MIVRKIIHGKFIYYLQDKEKMRNSGGWNGLITNATDYPIDEAKELVEILKHFYPNDNFDSIHSNLN